MGDETVCGMMRARVEKYGDRVLMRARLDGEWREWSWNEFYERVRVIALALLTMNVAPGDRVAIFAENGPEWQMVDQAVLAAGAVDVPLYSSIPAGQARYILADSGSKFVFVGGREQLQRVLEVRDGLPDLRKVITMDGATSDHPDVITLGDLAGLGEKNANPDLLGERIEAVAEDDLCSIVYTSGTTGEPKGVMLTHRNFMSNVSTVSTIIEIRDSYEVLSFLPLSHVLERMSGYYGAIYNGCTISHAGSMDTLVEDIAEIRPHWMVSVPRLYEKIYAGVLANVESEARVKQRIFHWAIGVGREVSALRTSRGSVPRGLRRRYRLADRLVFSRVYRRMGGRLLFFVSGGAPLAREIAEFFHAMGILILEGYGLTETSPVLTCNTPDNVRFGSVGKPIPGVEVRIGEDGEILARGPNVMRGYWNRKAETSEALAGGWFHTGDVGAFDEDGYLYITDRKKDLIVTAGGKNVSPQNLENALKMSRYIEQAAVVGDRRPFVSALIVPSFSELESWAEKHGIEATDRESLVADQRVRKLYGEEIEETLRGFDRHESVGKFTLLPREMTEADGLLTPTLKIRREMVGERFGGEIESMYE